MSKDDEMKLNLKQESISVGEFRPEDADGIVRLFRSVYGEGYPVRTFYDSQAIIEANEAGKYHSIVARTDSGQVVGVNHLLQTAPYHGVYEIGAGLVMKEYRGSGAMTRIMDYLIDVFPPRHAQIEELFGEPVCNHTFLQREVSRFGFIETGIEIALMPAEAYAQEKSASGRVATLDVFRCYASKPHRIFVPRIYEEVLRRVYARLDDRREIALSGEALPDGATRASIQVFDFARVARIAVSALGADFAARLSDLEEEARSQQVMVFQVWLNLTEPWVEEAVQVLRDRGYFFGAALPRWFDGDGLLMQRLDCAPNFDDIVLFSDFSKDLLDFITEDRERSGKGKN